MGFGLLNIPITPTKKGVASKAKDANVLGVLHRAECKACPLNKTTCRSPKMEPLGNENARIYILGASPNRAADNANEPFAGEDWALIRKAIPREAHKTLRLNNVIKCFPGNDKKPVPHRNKDRDAFYAPREPKTEEIECCRPQTIRDIEATKPDAIFGFGSPPLRAYANETHPQSWMGRRIPIKVGNHACWYYPFPAPVDVIKERRWDGFQGDLEFAFKFYLRRATQEVLDGLPDPVIHDKERIWQGVEIITGAEGDADLGKIESFLKYAAKQEVNGFDIETDRLRPYNKGSRLLTVGISAGDRHVAFPFDHPGASWTRQQLEWLEAVFYDWLKSKARKAVHQLAFELEWMGVMFGADVIWGGNWEDTIGQAYVVNETQGLLALESRTVELFGFNIKEQSKVNRKALADEPLEDVLWYNALDAKYHKEVYIEQIPLVEDNEMEEVYENQRERVHALVLTQMKGVPIDPEEVKAFAKPWVKKQKDAEEALFALPEVEAFKRKHGHEYRVSAPEDLAAYLTGKGVKLSKSAKSGRDQTLAKDMHKHEKDPVVKYTMAWRKAAKILSTYVSAVEPGAKHLFDDGMLHPIISCTKVQTWRTSSEDPNIQNWPNRGPNYVIRKVVKPPLKKDRLKFVKVDYASIQARNVAMESQDETLVQAFIDGYDIHADWTKRISELFPDWCPDGFFSKDKEEAKGAFKGARGVVKNQFVFPSFFGARPSEKMSLNFGDIMGTVPVPVDTLAKMQGEFWQRFKGVRRWQEKRLREFERDGYVSALSGFRRHAPCEFNQVINSGIQSDESIIVMSAMIALSKLGIQPVMEIHDDLSFIIPESILEDRIHTIVTEMVKPRYEWIGRVPLVVEVSVGDNWAECKEIGHFENVGKDGKYRQLK